MTILRSSLVAIGILLFVIIILPVIIMGVWNTGNYIGLMLSACFIAYGLFFGKINRFIVYLAKQNYGKALIILFSALVLALFVFAVIITVHIVDKSNNPPEGETTVIVLGCRVRESGASTMLKTRLDATYDFLCKNKNAKCVLSGGKGKDEPIAEAEYMRDWLVKKGIDSSRLYVENKSTSTEENMAFSKKIIEENGLSKRITVITNEFHQYRAYRFAVQNSFDAIFSYSAKTPWYALPSYYVREICGVAHMIFIG